MRLKKWFAVLTICLLSLSTFSIQVSSDENTNNDQPIVNIEGKYSAKDEVIYGNLDLEGNIKNLYVVNSFHVSEPGGFIDYGKYADVRNLTDLTEIKTVDDEVHFEAEEGEFYYQGELESHVLPWNISVTYLLDGEEVNPENLSGENGELEVQISTSENEDFNPLFYENYLLQISLTFDPARVGEVHAPKGTEAIVGKNKQIAFTVMPGQEEELILSAEIKDFEMEPINISAIPANIAFDTPDLDEMTEDMKLLSDGINEINDGVSELRKGLSELSKGASGLRDGSGEYKQGLNELNNSSKELVNGSSAIQNGLKQMNQALKQNVEIPDMSDMLELPKNLRDMAEGLDKIAGGLGEVEGNLNKLVDGLDEMFAALPTEDLTNQIGELLYELDILDASEKAMVTVGKLAEGYGAGRAIKQQYEEKKLGGNLRVIAENISKFPKGIKQISTGLNTMATEIEKELGSLDGIDGILELQNGLATFATEYQVFHKGLVDYTKGVNALATSYNELDKGIGELAKGTTSVYDGVSELHEGTKELADSTNDLPDQMQSEIEDLMDEYDFSDFQAESFVSDQNKNVGIVQFVLQTESIKIKEKEVTDEEKEVEKGFWQRLIDLFK